MLGAESSIFYYFKVTTIPKISEFSGEQIIEIFISKFG